MPNSALPGKPAGDPTRDPHRILATARQLLNEQRSLEAARAFAAVLAVQPECVEAHAQLGQLLFQSNQFPAALQCLQQAARLSPDMPRLNSLIAAVLRKQGRLAESAASCERETRISPNDPDAHYNLALARQTLQQIPEAIAAYRAALRLRPDYLDALLGLGRSLRQDRQTEAALHCFTDAVRLAPSEARAHWELGTTQLALGQFAAGWQGFEWRWQLKDFTTPPPRYQQPQWDGRDLGDRRIFLHCEQGYGDVIQFVRYAALVAARGGHVLLGCPQPLQRLMETVPGVAQIVTTRENLPPFDTHAPLMSLPSIFGTTLETIPGTIPYLHPRITTASKWIEAFPGKNVGVAWAGSSAHPNDANRSLPPQFLKPLLRLPGIRWHSLQTGDAARVLAQPDFAGRIFDLGSRLSDFYDTAEAIRELDLVLAVDTAVAHLAGALRKTVWLLLPYEAEWRWMTARDDSPWYPTMRLFHQSSPGNWEELLERVASQLQIFFGHR
jgi:cytochrome c-type biogenesis protein CcmH/NrfG